MKDVILTMLYTYPAVDGIIEGMERLITYKALSSCTGSDRTVPQLNKIVLLGDKLTRIKEYKTLINRLISQLSYADRVLVEYKYFRKEPPEWLDVTSRKYYRKQNQILHSLICKAGKMGLDVSWFEQAYLDFYFISHKYGKIKELNKKCRFLDRRIAESA